MVKTGPVFTEGLFGGKPRRKARDLDSNFKTRGLRLGLLFGILTLSIAIIVLRLIFLQVVEGHYFRNLADNNRTRTVLIHAPRGVIFDRNGKPLTFNLPGFREVKNGKTELLTQEEALSKIAKGKKDLEIDSLRNYPYKDVFSHVIGYLGQISPDQLNGGSYPGYQSGDIIGEMGLEKEYEGVLRGADGKELVEVDSVGKTVRSLGKTDPISGQDINTTLDLNLQKAAYQAMSKIKKGVVIATTPKGEVLTLVSKPSFDPNLFTMGTTYKTATDAAYKKVSDVLLDGENQPLLNRAIGGVYPPGSTFKIVNASAGLSRGVIDANYQVADTGILKVGDFSFSNWYYTQYGRTDGNVNVVKGLQRSNDIFFYKLAEKIGVDNLSATAAKFEVGKTLNIDLPGETDGVLPTQEWKEKVIGEPWYLGDTYHYGIGQGYLLSTPLQVNAWAQIVANDGTLYKPHLLSGMAPSVLEKGLLDPKSTSLVRQGMIEACSTGGVAYPLFNFTVKNPYLKIDGKNILEVKVGSSSAVLKDQRRIVVACKTGTAQHGDESTLPHAWITLFAPAYNPQIVVTVLAESSGEGSNVAAPVAKEVLSEWFSNQ